MVEFLALRITYNFYAGRSLPAPLQHALQRYTNLFGIIIWRVLVNFFIRISRDAARRYPSADWARGRASITSAK